MADAADIPDGASGIEGDFWAFIGYSAVKKDWRNSQSAHSDFKTIQQARTAVLLL